MLNEIAKTLDQAATSAKSVDMISLTHTITLDQAYEIQAKILELRYARGEKLVGYKMGFTSKAKMIQMGVDNIIWGRLTDAMAIKADQEIDVTDYVHPRAEPEIAFLLKAPLSGIVTKEQALAAVESIAPAIELIDSRYTNFKFSLTDVVADNTSSSRFLIGPWMPSDSNIDGLAMDFKVDGKIVASGSSNDILDHPINSLVEAARVIGEAGEELKAGHIILAGAATAATAIQKNQTISVDVANLGSCQFKTKA
ncbi:MAG: 2-keto-4-pentenoate hydratase [Paraglaciecola sp.]|jgi:2-keto-4-pentenoate hydratase